MALPDGTTTASELLSQPDDDRRRELLAGRIVTEPPASFSHGSIAAEVFMRLQGCVGTAGLGRVLSTETGFLLARDPDTVRAPDVAYVSRRRLEEAGEFRGYFPGPPDLAVEILSPSERPADIQAKVRDYLAAGTRQVWLIDPVRREVRVHRPGSWPEVRDAEAVLDAEDLLPGFRVQVGRLFPD